MSSFNLSGLRAVAYLRCSTTRQETSIPDQRSWVLAKAGECGLEVVAAYEDEGVPGSEDARPGWLALRAALEAGRPRRRGPAAPGGVEALLCWDLDRLSRRDLMDAQAELSHVRRAGVRYVVTNAQVYDLRDAMDRVMMAFQQELGKRAYVVSLARNVARAQAERARLGLWVAGPTPYGYRVGDSGKLATDPPKARVLRAVVRDVLGGKSLGEVCDDLHARGVPGPGRSGRWARSQLQKMVTDMVYAGVFEWPKVRQGKYAVPGRNGVADVEGGDDRRTYSVVPEGDRIVIEGNHEAIVTREQVERVREALASRRHRRSTPQRGGGEWVLSGLAKCSCCGGSLIGRTRRHEAATYRYLVCGSRHRFGSSACKARRGVGQSLLVRSLVADLPRWFKESDRMAKLREAIDARQRSEGDRVAEERARLGEAVAAADAWLERAAVNVLEVAPDIRPAAERAIRQRRESRDADAARLKALDAQAQEGQASRAGFVKALGALEGLTDHIADAPPALVRRLLSALVERVTLTLDGDDVTAEVTFRPEATSTTAYVFPVDRSRRQVCGVSVPLILLPPVASDVFRGKMSEYT